MRRAGCGVPAVRRAHGADSFGVPSCGRSRFAVVVLTCALVRRSVSSRGFRISYRQAGQGYPLLLLGGLSQWADQWWDFGYADLLGGRFRLIAVDRLGHGESDKPHESEPYDERLIVEDLVAVLDAEGIHRALVWGFSLGAKNAASLAALHPQRVMAMVSGSVPALTRPEQSAIRTPRARCEVFVCGDVDRGLASLRHVRTCAHRASASPNDPEALAAAALGTCMWWPDLTAITVPALWYIGAGEGGFYEEEVQYADAHAVETHEVPDASHWTAFAQAAEVTAFVKPFLLRYVDQ